MREGRGTERGTERGGREKKWAREFGRVCYEFS